MILVDTSVWIDFFRHDDATLATLLDDGLVLCHPWVVGELALGRLEAESEHLGLIKRLPMASVATDDEVLRVIETGSLASTGIGYVDAQLVAAAKLTWDAVVWTRDKRLSAVCDRLGIAYSSDSKGPEV